MRVDGARRCVGRCRTGIETEVRDLVALPRGVAAETPLPAVCLHRRRRQGDFHTFTCDVPHVAQHLLVEVGAGGNRNGSQQVFGPAVVTVYRTCDPVAEKSEIKSPVPCFRRLPLQPAVVGRRTVSGNGPAAEHIAGAGLAERVQGLIAVVGNTVLLSGHAITGTQLQRAENRLQRLEEILLRHTPAQSDRREGTPSAPPAEA